MNKKIFYFLAFWCLCVCSGGFLTSCGDDEDEPKDGDLVERLQGTWYIDRMKISVLGQNMEFTADELKDESGYDRFYDETLKFDGEKGNGLSYSVDKNSILLPWYTEQGWWCQVSFSGSKMTMYYDLNYEGINMQLWTTYVKSGSRSSLSPAITSTNPEYLLPHILKSLPK